MKNIYQKKSNRGTLNKEGNWKCKPKETGEGDVGVTSSREITQTSEAINVIWKIRMEDSSSLDLIKKIVDRGKEIDWGNWSSFQSQMWLVSMTSDKSDVVVAQSRIFSMSVFKPKNLLNLRFSHSIALGGFTLGGAYWVLGRISKKATEKSCIWYTAS